jgi:hypothetical protein
MWHRIIGLLRAGDGEERWRTRSWPIFCCQKLGGLTWNTKTLINTGRCKRRSQCFGRCSIGHCKKKIHMNWCLILNGYRYRAVWICGTNCLRFFCVCCWMKSEACKREVDTRDELLDRILNASARIKKRGDQLSDVHHANFAHKLQGALKLTWDFRTFIVNCNKFALTVWHICHLYIKGKIKWEISNFCFGITIHNANFYF